MTMMRWLRAGRSTRGTPALRRPLGGRAVHLAALVAVALAATGCQSGLGSGCNTCDTGCGGGKCCGLRAFRDRVFRRGASAGTVIVPSTPVVDSAAPVVTTPSVGSPSVVTPSVVTPSAPLGSSSSAPTTVIPPAGGTESSPSQLSPAEPAPSAIPGPAPSSDTTGAKSPTGKVNYEAYRPRTRPNRSRAEALARTEIPTLEPAPRPAQASPAAQDADPLDNLPPIELSNDVPYNDATPPAAPPAERAPKPGAAAAAEPHTEAAPAASPPPSPVNASPGLRRFASFEPKLAGGSVPTTEGLDWLVEKGYKTILDLREPGAVQPSFIAEVSNRGLRYVALPVTVKSLDAERVARFNYELSLSDARPLYFCDTDGARAGILWYVRRMTKDKLDPQLASREAEQMGQIDQSFWRAAQAFLDTQKPATAEAKAPPSSPPAGPEASAPAPNPPADAEPTPAPAVADSSPSADVETPAPPVRSSDPTAWRSYAALMITGLGVPLAYWSRASFPTFRGLKRASLAAPARRSKALPSSSDV